MSHEDRDTREWGDEEMMGESERDLRELPTVRWIRAAVQADEHAPITIRWGSDATAPSSGR